MVDSSEKWSTYACSPVYEPLAFWSYGYFLHCCPDCPSCLPIWITLSGQLCQSCQQKRNITSVWSKISSLCLTIQYKIDADSQVFAPNLQVSLCFCIWVFFVLINVCMEAICSALSVLFWCTWTMIRQSLLVPADCRDIKQSSAKHIIIFSCFDSWCFDFCSFAKY